MSMMIWIIRRAKAMKSKISRIIHSRTMKILKELFSYTVLILWISTVAGIGVAVGYMAALEKILLK